MPCLNADAFGSNLADIAMFHRVWINLATCRRIKTQVKLIPFHQLAPQIIGPTNDQFICGLEKRALMFIAIIKSPGNFIELLRRYRLFREPDIHQGPVADAVFGIPITFYQTQIPIMLLCFWIKPPRVLEIHIKAKLGSRLRIKRNPLSTTKPVERFEVRLFQRGSVSKWFCSKENGKMKVKGVLFRRHA